MPIDLSLSYENRFENELLDSSSSQHSRLFATWRSSFPDYRREKKTGAMRLCFPVAGKTTRLPRTGKA